MNTEGSGQRVARWFNIQGPDGRFLVAFFDGEPEWCQLRTTARQYCASAADSALRKLRALGLEAAAVTA